MFNLHHLRYFYLSAQCGSITRAAELLGISQPSLSMQIKQFEKQIGIKVLARSGRTLTLTPKGRELFDYSARFFAMTGEIERYIKKNEPVTKKLDLRVGVSEDVERPFVADVLGKLVKIHRSKKLSSTILSQPHAQLVELLEGSELDVIVCNHKVRHARLIAEIKIPVVLATAAQVKGSRNPTASNLQAFLEVLGQNLILPMESMVLGRETREFLKTHGMKVRPSLQSNILGCIVRAVEEGVGAAFLPIAYLHAHSERVKLHYFGPTQGYWQHMLYLYSSKDNTNEFLQDLSKIVHNLSAPG